MKSINGQSAPDLIRKKLSLISEIGQQGDNVVCDIMRVVFREIGANEYIEYWNGFIKDALDEKVYSPMMVYVHLPFCTATCFCCKFATQTFKKKTEIEQYLSCLHKEIRIWKRILSPISIQVIHVGGGSPSLLSEEQLENLLKTLNESFRQESPFYFCLEMDPHTTTLRKMQILKRYGVRRVSFGVQSFSKRVLKAINRSYQTPKRIREAVSFCRQAGIEIVNFDIMAGLPEDTEESFGETILESLQLSPESIYIYRFINWNSPLYHSGYSVNREDTHRSDKLMLLADRLIHEVRPPLIPETTRKNPSYGCQYFWNDSFCAKNIYDDLRMDMASHLGLGFGALSHIHGRLYSIHSGGLDEYYTSLGKGELLSYSINAISTQFDMSFYAANRVNSGVLSSEKFRDIFKHALDEIFGLEIRYLLSNGMIKKRDQGYEKRKGISLSENDILCAIFFSVAHLERTLDVLNKKKKEKRKPNHPAFSRRNNSIIRLGAKHSEREIDAGLEIVRRRRADRVDILDDKKSSQNRLVEVIGKAKEAGAREIVAWSDGRRFSSKTLALAAVKAGLTGAVISVQGKDADPKEKSTEKGSVSRREVRGVENLLDMKTANVKVHVVVENTNKGRLPSILKGFAELGIENFLIDLKESISQNQGSEILHIASSKKLRIETYNRFRESPFGQFNTITEEPCVPLFHCLHYISAVPSYKIVEPIQGLGHEADHCLQNR